MRAQPTGGNGIVRLMAEIARHLIIGAHVLNIVSNSENLVDDTGIEPVTYISISPHSRNSYLVHNLHDSADIF